jgi:hypothetical protein
VSENKQVDDWAEADLAWELVEIARHYIPERNRTEVYTAIGAGDCYAAIDTLLDTIARASVVVPPVLVARIVDWLNAYAHHAEAPRLHELLNAIRSLGHTNDGGSPRKAP